MINTLLTGVALLASTALAGPGSAIVVNKCDYGVHLSNTPAMGGGYSAINQMLSPGGTYSQVYTELSNGNGWSIKLSRDGNFISNLMQYEYTYHDDGTIWYDLSEVDGNPWDGNWEITASSGCTPRQAAYRFSTDDAYGMQSCADTATITVTLCSGTSGGSPGTWGSSSPSEAPTSAAPTSEAPSSAAPTTSSKKHHWGPPGGIGNKVVESPSDAPEVPAAQPSDNWDGPAVTVTNVAFKTVTNFVTAVATPGAHKRHVHHPRHPHHHA